MSRAPSLSVPAFPPTLSFYLPRREISVHHSEVFQVTHPLGDLTADQQETLDAERERGREKMKNLKWGKDFSLLKGSFFSLSPAQGTSSFFHPRLAAHQVGLLEDSTRARDFPFNNFPKLFFIQL